MDMAKLSSDPRVRPLSAWLALARTEITPLALLLGAAVLALGFWHIAEEMTEGDTHRIDLAILYALRQPGAPAQPIGPPWLTLAAVDLTSLGSIAVLGVILLLVCGLFLSLRRWRETVVLVLASAGGLALSDGLKLAFGRERPPQALHVVQVINASFPSGHAMLSAVAYLTLGALAAHFATRRRVKIYALTAAMILTLAVGSSRVYLGVHWPSDVLAGWCVGAAWAMVCWLGAYLWERRIRAGSTAEATSDPEP